MNESLLLLQKGLANVAIINTIFRSAHSLKGMSATMGFKDMASLTHEMENVLDQASNGQPTLLPPVLDTIFQCLDILENMVFSVTVGENAQHDVSSVLEQFKKLLSEEAPLESAVKKKEENQLSTQIQ
jgi:two-component system chemotaxis sensor kinase CheA